MECKKDEICVVIVDIRVPSSLCLTRSLRADIVEVFVKHILYIRGQIPTPYAQLVASRSLECQKSFKIKAAARKTNKFVDEMTQLIAGLRDIFLHAEKAPDEACLLLGASPRCPRESFTIRFDQRQNSVGSISEPGMSEGVPMEPEARVADTLKRRVIRELVTQWTGGDTKAHQYNSYLAVHAPNNTTTIDEDRLVASSNTTCGCGHFGVADSFRPRTRRRAPPPLVCSLQSDVGQNIHAPMAVDGVWYVSRRGLRPLKATERSE
jgi:hypothetical protein